MILGHVSQNAEPHHTGTYPVRHASPAPDGRKDGATAPCDLTGRIVTFRSKIHPQTRGRQKSMGHNCLAPERHHHGRVSRTRLGASRRTAAGGLRLPHRRRPTPRMERGDRSGGRATPGAGQRRRVDDQDCTRLAYRVGRVSPESRNSTAAAFALRTRRATPTATRRIPNGLGRSSAPVTVPVTVRRSR